MDKSTFIDTVAQKADVSKKVTAAVVKAVLDTIEDVIVSKDEITFIGFGRFGSKIRSARIGHNLQTGEEIKIPEKRVPYFKPSKTLRDKCVL